MTPLQTVPDIERLVSDYLRTHADIVALSTRVVGAPPPGNLRTQSWIEVTDLGSPQVNRPDHLVESMMRIACYAGSTGGQPEVNTMYRAVRAVLGSMAAATHSLGVVTDARIVDSTRDADTFMEPARDRRIVTAMVWNHS